MIKKRGRPKGIKKIKEIKPEYKEPSSHKFLGYCNKCGSLIASVDLQSKFIWKCPACGKRARTNKLKIKNQKSNLKNTSKKEYLKDTISVHEGIEEQTESFVDFDKIKPLDM